MSDIKGGKRISEEGLRNSALRILHTTLVQYSIRIPKSLFLNLQYISMLMAGNDCLLLILEIFWCQSFFKVTSSSTS